MKDKPLLKLGFTDYCYPIDMFFMDTLSKIFNVVRDDVNPDYLIFCDETFGQNNNNFNHKKVIKIFFTGENRRPQNYNCHFAISFDHDSNPKHYRLPLYVLDNFVNKNMLNLPDISEVSRTTRASDKSDFCSFVVKNPSCEERNKMFHMLSQYKRVDSGGPLFNNSGEILNKEGLDGFHLSKKSFLEKRKFNLCYENSSFPGYVTEKIFHALTYNTIPIYWGSPTIALDFNIDAIISRHEFESDKEMLDFIVHLDNNDEEYNKMVQKPILSKHNRVLDLERFNRWFSNTVYHGVLNG